MKNKKHLVVLFTLATITLCNCYKTDTTIKLDQNIVSHFSFQPSSYWLYKDSVSGQIDSLVVKENKRGVYQSSDSRYDDLEILVVRYTYGQIIDSGFALKWLLSANDVQLTVVGLTSKRPEISTGISYPLNAESVDNVIDRMSVLNTDYLNVLQLRTNSPDYIYAIQNVGVIKMRLVSFLRSPVWELQKANIIIK